jgi:hypothetical protein
VGGACCHLINPASTVQGQKDACGQAGLESQAGLEWFHEGQNLPGQHDMSVDVELGRLGPPNGNDPPRFVPADWVVYKDATGKLRDLQTFTQTVLGLLDPLRKHLPVFNVLNASGTGGAANKRKRGQKSKGDLGYPFYRRPDAEPFETGMIAQLAAPSSSVGRAELVRDNEEGTGKFVVISDAQLLIAGGDHPETAREKELCHWVAKVGEVQILVRGSVKVGDFIGPYGDGSGIGVVKNAGAPDIVGESVEQKLDEEVRAVTVSCHFDMPRSKDLVLSSPKHKLKAGPSTLVALRRSSICACIFPLVVAGLIMAGLIMVVHLFTGKICTAPAGRYCVVNKLPFNTAPCPAGYYCTGGTSDKKSCTASAGRYCDKGSSREEGEQCPAGYYCTGGTSDKKSCSTVDVCPAGEYHSGCGGGSTGSCVPCPQGQYKDISESASCRPCTASAGRYCDKGSSSEEGEQCPAGYYCTGGISDKKSCTASAGRYCDQGSSNAEGEQCPAGYYCTGGISDKKSCTASAGRYCDQGSSNEEGEQCPAGYYCTGGIADKKSCTASAGRYCDQGSSNEEGEQCPAGYYCAGGISDKESCSTVDVCPAGEYRSGCGGGSTGKCVPCPPGQYKDISGSASCNTCQAGTYASLTGSTVCTSCGSNQVKALLCTGFVVGFESCLRWFVFEFMH